MTRIKKNQITNSKLDKQETSSKIVDLNSRILILILNISDQILELKSKNCNTGLKKN